METAKRLIPYSVHLPEHIYKKLKAAAQNRKATSLVRDAITMIIEGEDEFNAGYNKALRDTIAMIKEHSIAGSIGVDGLTIAEHLAEEIEHMIVPQNTKAKHHAKTK